MFILSNTLSDLISMKSENPLKRKLVGGVVSSRICFAKAKYNFLKNGILFLRSIRPTVEYHGVSYLQLSGGSDGRLGALCLFDIRKYRNLYVADILSSKTSLLCEANVSLRNVDRSYKYIFPLSINVYLCALSKIPESKAKNTKN